MSNKKAEKNYVELDLSDGWYYVLCEVIERNGRYLESIGIEDEKTETLLYRNEKVMNFLETHTKDNGTIKLYPKEMRAVFWILIENIVRLNDELYNTKRIAAHCADDMMDVFGNFLGAINSTEESDG